MEKRSLPPARSVNRMDITLAQCFIAVDDHDQALALYRDVLGLEAMAELLAKGLLRGVIFRTDDCDATFERIRAAGGEVLLEPIDQPYGVRDCSFRDPSGNMLRFSQRRR